MKTQDFNVTLTGDVVSKSDWYSPQNQARIYNDTQRKIRLPEAWTIICELCGTNPANHPYGNVCDYCSSNLPF